jgi:hypothetical protein
MGSPEGLPGYETLLKRASTLHATRILQPDWTPVKDRSCGQMTDPHGSTGRADPADEVGAARRHVQRLPAARRLQTPTP